MATLMGLFASGRGIGAVLSGPVSEVLTNKPLVGDNIDGQGFGYGTGYGVLIVFTGVSALFGLPCFGAKRRGI